MPLPDDMPLTVTIYQGSAELGNKENNISKMKELMVEAKMKDADVVVFPELFTTGYVVTIFPMTS